MLSTCVDTQTGIIESVRKRQQGELTPFQERLRDAMKIAGVYTPADLSRKLKVGPQVAHKWWAGKTNPENIRAKDILKLADGLKVRVRWLLYGEKPIRQAGRPTEEEQDVLDLYRAFRVEHFKWRDDWVADGNRTLQNLTQPPTSLVPYPRKPK